MYARYIPGQPVATPTSQTASSSPAADDTHAITKVATGGGYARWVPPPSARSPSTRDSPKPHQQSRSQSQSQSQTTLSVPPTRTSEPPPAAPLKQAPSTHDDRKRKRTEDATNATSTSTPTPPSKSTAQKKSRKRRKKSRAQGSDDSDSDTDDDVDKNTENNTDKELPETSGATDRPTSTVDATRDATPSSNQGPSPSGPKPEKRKQDKPKRAKSESQAHDSAADPGYGAMNSARFEAILAKRNRSLHFAAAANHSSEKQDTPPQDQPSARNPTSRLPESTVPESPVPESSVPEQQQHGLEPLPQPAPAEEADGHRSRPPAFQTLPSWLAQPVRVSRQTTRPFTDLGVTRATAAALAARGFPHAFAVQTAVLPRLLLPGANVDPPSVRHCLRRDLLVSASTGSGKTLAYALPIVHDIALGTRHPVTRLQAVVVLPTRDLVRQAEAVFRQCVFVTAADDGDRDGDEGGENGAIKRVKVGTATGSHSFVAEQALLVRRDDVYDPEQYARRVDQHPHDHHHVRDNTRPDYIATYRSLVDILLTTPGRLVEHVQKTPGFTLAHVRWLVVDEADKILSQSFHGWLEPVLAALRPQILEPSPLLAAPEPRVDDDKAQRQAGPPNDTQLVSRGLSLSKSVSRDPAVSTARDFCGSPPSSARVPRQTVRKVVLSATLTRDLSMLLPLGLEHPELIVLDNSTLDDKNKADNDNEVDAEDDDDDDDNNDWNVGDLALPVELTEVAVRWKDEALKPLYLASLLYDGLLSSSIAPTPESATTADNAPTVLVFTRSNEAALRLGRLLALLHPDAASSLYTLTSDLPSKARRKILHHFTTTATTTTQPPPPQASHSCPRVLVASDLVSRGLDVPSLDHVVNYDVPPTLATYVHRVGRTARAHRAGTAWTLVPDIDVRPFFRHIADVHHGRGHHHHHHRVDGQASIWRARPVTSRQIVTREDDDDDTVDNRFIKLIPFTPQRDRRNADLADGECPLEEDQEAVGRLQEALDQLKASQTRA